MSSNSSSLITKAWKPFVTILKKKPTGDIAALIRAESIPDELKIAYVAAFTLAQYMHEGDGNKITGPNFYGSDTVACMYFLNETTGNPNCSKCVLNHKHSCYSFNSDLLRSARRKYKYRFEKCS